MEETLPANIDQLLAVSRGYIHATFNTLTTKHWCLDRFMQQYEVAAKYGFTGIVLHAPRLEDPMMDKVLALYSKQVMKKDYPKKPIIFLEHVVGKYLVDPTEFNEKIKQLNKKGKAPFGMCIDTCHLYSSGIPITSSREVENYFQQATYDCDFPILIHLNDSDNPINSGIDRHATLGTNIWQADKSGLKKIMSYGYDCILELSDPTESLKLLDNISSIVKVNDNMNE